jgi:hypothetical protein
LSGRIKQPEERTKESMDGTIQSEGRTKQSGWLRVVLVPLLVLIVLLLSPFIVSALLYMFARACIVYFTMWLVWMPKGKRVLVVHSDSPIWREYVSQNLLRPLGERAVVLNWSERKGWPRFSVAVMAFHHFGTDTAYNPLVVVFRRWRRAHVFRFWEPFKQYKQGDTEEVRALTKRVFDLVELHS